MLQARLIPIFAGLRKAVGNRLAFFHRSSEAISQATARNRFDTRKWNLELLKQLEWRRFEELCVAYYQALGFKTQLEGLGADGGIDIVLQGGASAPGTSIARCKAWDAHRVGSKTVKELRTAMTSAKVTDAVLLTSGRFTQEAIDLARKERIETVDGAGLIEKMAALPTEQSLALLKFATQGDFLTPTCPRCSVKMVSRQSTKGGRKFWGCKNYPQCKQTLFVSAPG